MAVSVGGPSVEGILIESVRLRVHRQLIGAGKDFGVARVQRIGGAAARHLALTVARAHRRGISGGIDADAVQARPQHRKRQIRRVDLIGFIVIEAANTQ